MHALDSHALERHATSSKGRHVIKLYGGDRHNRNTEEERMSILKVKMEIFGTKMELLGTELLVIVRCLTGKKDAC